MTGKKFFVLFLLSLSVFNTYSQKLLGSFPEQNPYQPKYLDDRNISSFMADDSLLYFFANDSNLYIIDYNKGKINQTIALKHRQENVFLNTQDTYYFFVKDSGYFRLKKQSILDSSYFYSGFFETPGFSGLHVNDSLIHFVSFSNGFMVLNQLRKRGLKTAKTLVLNNGYVKPPVYFNDFILVNFGENKYLPVSYNLTPLSFAFDNAGIDFKHLPPLHQLQSPYYYHFHDIVAISDSSMFAISNAVVKKVHGCKLETDYKVITGFIDYDFKNKPQNTSVLLQDSSFFCFVEKEYNVENPGIKIFVALTETGEVIKKINLNNYTDKFSDFYPEYLHLKYFKYPHLFLYGNGKVFLLNIENLKLSKQADISKHKPLAFEIYQDKLIVLSENTGKVYVYALMLD